MTKRKEPPKTAAEARVRRGRAHIDSAGFTDMERLFILHYMGAGNRVIGKSALLAGYGKGNLRAAQKTGSDVMARKHVMAEIERLSEARNTKLSMHADDVLRELIVLKTDAEYLPKTVQSIKTRREILKDLGDHVNVGAFRRNLGLSSPTGGPIETIDLAALATLNDEELDIVARAREIIDRIARSPRVDADNGADTGGTGATPEGE